MLDIIQSLRSIVDAPLEVVMACPIGIVAALHFASDQTQEIKGARCDSIVQQAKAAAITRPRWVKTAGITLGLGIATFSFMYLQDQNFWPRLLAQLPIPI